MTEIGEQAGQFNYRRALRASALALLRGVFDYGQFFDAMMVAIRQAFTRAWYDGAKSVGVQPSELTPEERLALDAAIFEEYGYIDGLAAFVESQRVLIEAGDKKISAARAAVNNRLELWQKRYRDVESRAQQMAGNDAKLQWTLGVGVKEHCSSCLRLSAKIKRSSYWKRVDVRPQHESKLVCMLSARGPSVCQCTFEPTKERCSPGPLPRLP